MRKKSRRESHHNITGGNHQNNKNFSGLDTCPSKGLSVDNINLSFAGCGFNGIYYVGVASCFLEYCPKVSFNKISGVSAGSLVATALACQMPLAQSTSEVLKVAIQARSRALGPFHPTFDVNKIITDALEKCLPDDAHKRVNGRLHISVTRVSDGKNVILSQFDSKQDLIQAVLCSCFIPFWSGIFPPKFHGVSYIDGGLSNNLIILDENTVTVTPFAGESDICPMDVFHPSYQINILNTSFAMTPSNIYRLYGLLFPPPPETMSKMCHQGFDDALRFLQRNNKISCLRCVAIQSSFTVAQTDKIMNSSGVSVDLDVDEDIGNDNDLMVRSRNLRNARQSYHEHEFDGCEDCERRRDTAFMDSLPDPVAKAIQETCDQFDKGLINWLFKHRPMKMLSIMTLPYVLPFDITIVLLTKLWRQVPWMKKEVNRSLLSLYNLTKSLLMKVESNRALYSAQFSCQLSVTEFAYNPEVSVRDAKDSADDPDVVVLTGPPTPQQAATLRRKISMSPSSHSLSSMAPGGLSPPRTPMGTGPSPPRTPSPPTPTKSQEGPPPDVIPQRRMSSASSRRVSRLERSHTFGGRRKNGVDVSSLHQQPPVVPTVSSQARGSAGSPTKLARKSYAGSEQFLAAAAARGGMDRKTSLAVGGTTGSAASAFAPPERILSTVNFGFTMDLASSKSPRASSRSLHRHSSSRSLGLAPDPSGLDDDEFAPHGKGASSSPPDVLETLKHLTEESSTEVMGAGRRETGCTSGGTSGTGGEISALSLANRALNWERQQKQQLSRKTSMQVGGSRSRGASIAIGGGRRSSDVPSMSRLRDDVPDVSQQQPQLPTPDTTDGFDRILAATTSQEKHPLMAYYYMDENNQVKMTEIFNIPDDADISPEELQKRW